MKHNIKKYLFLINDISALFLAKEIKKERDQIIRLHNYLKITIILLAISMVINIVLLFR